MGEPEAQDAGTGDPEAQDAGTGDPEGQDAGGLGTWAFGAWRVGRPSGPPGVNPALIDRLRTGVSPSVQSAGQPHGPIVTLTPEHRVYLGLPIKRRPSPCRARVAAPPRR